MNELYIYIKRLHNCNCASRYDLLLSIVDNVVCFFVAEQCTFICGDTRFKGILGQTFSIRCLLSNGTLMRNLSWYKGKTKILDGVSYGIHHGQKEFVLKIHQLSQEDSGDYVCSGFDIIMGNQFNSTVHLDVTDSDKACKCFLGTILMCNLGFLMFIVAAWITVTY